MSQNKMFNEQNIATALLITKDKLYAVHKGDKKKDEEGVCCYQKRGKYYSPSREVVNFRPACINLGYVPINLYHCFANF